MGRIVLTGKVLPDVKKRVDAVIREGKFTFEEMLFIGLNRCEDILGIEREKENTEGDKKSVIQRVVTRSIKNPFKIRLKRNRNGGECKQGAVDSDNNRKEVFPKCA